MTTASRMISRPERGTNTSPSSTAAAQRDSAIIDFALLDVDSVLQKLETSRNGLREVEVVARRARVGRNEVAHEKPPSWYVQLAHAFANPFNFLLATLALLSGFTGDYEAMTDRKSVV